MDGLMNKNREVALFLGKLPNRKQECFYFVEGNYLIPVAYAREENLAEAKILWAKILGVQEEAKGNG